MLTEIPAESLKAPLVDSTASVPVDEPVTGEKPKSPEVKSKQDLPKDAEVKLLSSQLSY